MWNASARCARRGFHGDRSQTISTWAYPRFGGGWERPIVLASDGPFRNTKEPRSRCSRNRDVFLIFRSLGSNPNRRKRSVASRLPAAKPTETIVYPTKGCYSGEEMQPSSPSQPSYQQPPSQYPGQPPGPYSQPPMQSMAPPLGPPSHKLRNVAIIVVIGVVILAVALLAEYHSSTLFITVTSNHISNTVSYILTVDGRQVDSGTLTPGQSVDDAVSLSWWVDNCQVHSATATSTGGGLGPETDTATGIICSGVPASASLSI